jgi:serine/threonine protein kinase
LHDDMNIANRDIKLENILYISDGDRVKITDFTTAIAIPNEDFSILDREGTKAFEAPECALA